MSLATLTEAEHYPMEPMDPPGPIEAIKFRMEQQGLSRQDLETEALSRMSPPLLGKSSPRILTAGLG